MSPRHMTVHQASTTYTRTRYNNKYLVQFCALAMPGTEPAGRQRHDLCTAVLKPQTRVGCVGGAPVLSTTDALPLFRAAVIATGCARSSAGAGALLQRAVGKRRRALRGLATQCDVDLVTPVCAYAHPHTWRWVL